MDMNYNSGPTPEFTPQEDDGDKVVCPYCGAVMNSPGTSVTSIKCDFCGGVVTNPYYKDPLSKVFKWILVWMFLAGIIIGIKECQDTSTLNKESLPQVSSSSYLNGSSGNSYTGDNSSSTLSSTNKTASLKAQAGEMIWAKTGSPGYYKSKGNQVSELWDDGSIAATYNAIGAYKNMSEFRKVFKGISFDNPYRTHGELNKAQGIMLFGPVNDDYDDYSGEAYSVYGLIMIIDNGFEYYENTLGKSDVFTFIQKLNLLDY